MDEHAIGFEEYIDDLGEVYRHAVCRCGWLSTPRRAKAIAYAAAVMHLRGWTR